MPSQRGKSHFTNTPENCSYAFIFLGGKWTRYMQYTCLSSFRLLILFVSHSYPFVNFWLVWKYKKCGEIKLLKQNQKWQIPAQKQFFSIARFSLYYFSHHFTNKQRKETQNFVFLFKKKNPSFELLTQKRLPIIISCCFCLVWFGTLYFTTSTFILLALFFLPTKTQTRP